MKIDYKYIEKQLNDNRENPEKLHELGRTLLAGRYKIDGIVERLMQVSQPRPGMENDYKALELELTK